VADAKTELIARIRAANRSRSPVLPVPRGYRRTGAHSPGAPELLDLFAERLTDYEARVVRAAPAGLADALASVVPAGARFVWPPGLPSEWAVTGTLNDGTVDDGSLTAADLDGFDGVLTGCAVAAAETGTIALDGSAGQGRRAITLVPDLHVCVVRADQVVETVPELLARLDPGRPLTLISGPSATSDIELQRVEGVHGPRTLVVVLVSGA
jgi:L-lactate dehydrogenase complex protein LldG